MNSTRSVPEAAPMKPSALLALIPFVAAILSLVAGLSQ
jgi:hypothetical protein